MKLILTLVGDVAVFFAALITTGNVLIYGVRSKFEASEIGRLLQSTFVCLALTLDYVAVRTVARLGSVPDMSSVGLIIRAVIYVAVGTIMCGWLIKIIRIQAAERNNSEKLR